MARAVSLQQEGTGSSAVDAEAPPLPAPLLPGWKSSQMAHLSEAVVPLAAGGDDESDTQGLHAQAHSQTKQVFCRPSACALAFAVIVAITAAAVSVVVVYPKPPSTGAIGESQQVQAVNPPVKRFPLRMPFVKTEEPAHSSKYRRSSDICNLSAPIPVVAPQKWQLGPAWRRVCSERNRKGEYPSDRNWCWVGVKRMCHWNIKNHVSWRTIQNKASDLGIAPPANEAPYSPLRNPEICDDPANGASVNVTKHELKQAREWFQKNVAVYVLSLPTSTTRWEQIKQRMDELEIPITKVPGVDMRLPHAIRDAKKQGLIPEEYNFTIAQENAYSWKHAMGSIRGTLGCASAHFRVQQRVMADGSPIALVMEDDSSPSDDFIPRLWKLVREELPCDWEAVALMSRCGYGNCISPRLTRVEPDPNEPEWRCRQGVNWGMHAVLYRPEALPRVQKLWKEVVFDEARPRCMDVDVALASISDKVSFYSVPSVQDPGFLQEMALGSARWDINEEAKVTVTTTTQEANSRDS